MLVKSFRSMILARSFQLTGECLRVRIFPESRSFTMTVLLGGSGQTVTRRSWILGGLHILKLRDMRRNDAAVMRAVVICYKPFLKPEEAILYCDLEHSQLAKRLKEWGIFKST